MACPNFSICVYLTFNFAPISDNETALVNFFESYVSKTSDKDFEKHDEATSETLRSRTLFTNC